MSSNTPQTFCKVTKESGLYFKTGLTISTPPCPRLPSCLTVQVVGAFVMCEC